MSMYQNHQRLCQGNTVPSRHLNEQASPYANKRKMYNVHAMYNTSMLRIYRSVF